MTKQEVIEKAWRDIGMDFDLIKNDLDENGVFLGDVDIIPDHVYEKCGTSRSIKGNRKVGDRPYSLKGIEDNNGWYNDLPSGSGIYIAFYENEEYRMFFNGTNFLYKGIVVKPSHWRENTKEYPKPLHS